MRTARTGTPATATAAVGLVLMALAGCADREGPSAPPAIDLADLTTFYPCGYGFQAGNDAGTVGVFLQPESPGLPPGEETIDLGDSDAWTGEVRVGRDLFANWCNDVIAEPEATVDETWALVDGVVVVTEPDEGAGTATMTATDLVAVDPDGTRHTLGDLVLTNTAWGTFAG